MKPVIRYRSQLLFRKSYKPNRVIRIRPAQKTALVVRPARAGPQINTHKTSSGVAKVRRSSRFPSRSSIAERPVDNRMTQERYLPGRPVRNGVME